MKARICVSAVGLAFVAGSAAAERVDGPYWDIDRCDNHGNLRASEELGIPFPPDEMIDAISYQTDLSACPGSDDPNFSNTMVDMINLTDRYWDNLFYVADFQDTFLSNVDGLADDAAMPGHEWFAFHIDSVGLNRPLVFESITPDGIFEPGEIWSFIIDDYLNVLGVPAHAFFSVGFAGASSSVFGETVSSGSIVHMIPAPGVLALLGLGGLAAANRRR